jgi:hypothetical protein
MPCARLGKSGTDPPARSGSHVKNPSVAPDMALQRTRRPRFRSGRSFRPLALPLNARPLGPRSRVAGEE